MITRGLRVLKVTKSSTVPILYSSYVNGWLALIDPSFS